MTFLNTIADIKNQTGIALAEALNNLGSEFAEQDLAMQWLSALHKEGIFHEEGWYAPPPRGIISLFGKPDNQFERICQPSFRPEYMWPGKDNVYQSEDMIAVYASPVHRATNLIGDFGLTLYNGTNSELLEHCETVLKSSLYIARHAKIGMPFNELYAFGMDYGASQGFANDIDSTSDDTGTNIGHTIPLSYKDDPTHSAISSAQSFEDIREALRTGRKFVNSAEKQKIEENMAFTIEPRFSTAAMPQTWFHLTVIFNKGEKTICHGFHPVFEKLGLKNLNDLLPQ